MQRTLNTCLQLSCESIPQNISNKWGNGRSFRMNTTKSGQMKWFRKKKTKTKIIIFIKVNDFPLCCFYRTSSINHKSMPCKQQARARTLLEKQNEWQRRLQNSYESEMHLNVKRWAHLCGSLVNRHKHLISIKLWLIRA